jgi:hypothetical protein
MSAPPIAELFTDREIESAVRVEYFDEDGGCVDDGHTPKLPSAFGVGDRHAQLCSPAMRSSPGVSPLPFG